MCIVVRHRGLNSFDLLIRKESGIPIVKPWYGNGVLNDVT